MKILDFISLSVAALLISGCAVNLPFSSHASTKTIEQAKIIKPTVKGPLKVEWNPSTFPDRIDIQGASGFVGSQSRTSLPIGPGLSTRILETLAATVGLSDTSNETLVISIKKAKTEFEFSAAFSNAQYGIDRAKCNLEAEFSLKGNTWAQTFHAEADEREVSKTNQTGLVEKVWDDIALQVAKSVAYHRSE